MPPPDPLYPLFPIACTLAIVMLFLVLLTSIIRRSWNLGVAFLCFWLFFENLTFGVNAVIWYDNADVKYYVYCDIGECTVHATSLLVLMVDVVTRVQIVSAVVKPMATLIIVRRLYLIISLQSVVPVTKSTVG